MGNYTSCPKVSSLTQLKVDLGHLVNISQIAAHTRPLASLVIFLVIAFQNPGCAQTHVLMPPAKDFDPHAAAATNGIVIWGIPFLG